jgi:hypothetical protein
MHKCSKCGNQYAKLIKGSRQCQPCRTKRHREYCKRVDYDKKRYWKNPQAEREHHTIRKYKVSQDDYNSMFSSQRGLCAICERKQEKVLDIDHCHETGAVRGLLCSNCNRMLGYAKDNRLTLQAAINYLTSPRKSQQNLSVQQVEPTQKPTKGDVT